MSLINQMLQDLDARQAQPGTRALPSEVRSLPPPPASRRPLVAGVVAVLALAAALVFYRWPAPPVSVPAEPVVPAVVAGPAVAEPPVSPVIEAAPALQPPPATAAAVAPGAALTPSPAAPVPPLVAPSPILPAAESPGLRAAPAASAPAGRKVVAQPLASDPPTKPANGGVAPSKPRIPTLVDATPSAATADQRMSIERSDGADSATGRGDADYRKAIAALNQGRSGEAVDALRSALRSDPLHRSARQLLLRLLLEAKRSDEAVAVLQEGLQGQPAQTGWAMTLARLQVERGDLAAAWKTLDGSLPAAAHSADYQGFAAHVLQRLGRSREALVRYQAATRLAPGDGRWWLGLGLAHEAEGENEEAREAFLHARQGTNLSPELAALVEQKLR